MHVSQRNIIKKLYSDFSEAQWINRENLRVIIEMGRHVPFGKEHRFGRTKTEADFRRNVPLSDNADYTKRPFGDFISFPARYTTSAPVSAGKQRTIPLTLESMRRFSSYVYDMPYTLSDVDWGTHLHTSVFPDRDTFSHGRLYEIYLSFLSFEGRIDFLSFVGGQDLLLFADSVNDVPYMKSWLAFATPELASIQSDSLYDTLLFFYYIENNWQTILSDMRRGEISADLCDEVKERLLELRPDEEWLDSLENILSGGFSEPIVPRLWQGLQFISGIGGTDCDTRVNALRRYIGKTPIFYSAYTIPECMIGVPLDFNKKEFALLPRSAYYEFIPAEGGEALTLDNIEAGKEYELVITTFSGMYRCRTGRIIRILSFISQTPIFEDCGRRDFYLSIAHEEFDEKNTSVLLSRMANDSGSSPEDLALGIDESVIPCRYVLFTEGEGCNAECLDSVLRELSPDYSNMRDMSMIAPPVVCTVAKGELEKSLSAAEESSASKPRMFSDRARSAYLFSCKADGGAK